LKSEEVRRGLPVIWKPTEMPDGKDYSWFFGPEVEIRGTIDADRARLRVCGRYCRGEVVRVVLEELLPEHEWSHVSGKRLELALYHLYVAEE
jgi:hypothetical protein